VMDFHDLADLRLVELVAQLALLPDKFGNCSTN
jgi:hypothetical protein